MAAINATGEMVPELCSIILPTYNRAAFLPDAIASVAAQHYRRWELIVVDDGSTDETRRRVAALAAGLPCPLRYVHQANAGAGPARARGLEFAQGEYVAFLDSDDLWLPHHLSESIAALRANPALGWIYSALSVVELGNGRVVQADSFRPTQRGLPFLQLRTRPGGGSVRIFDDPATCRCAIEDGLYNGLQVSVLRRGVFAAVPMPPLRIGEDRCFSIQAVRRGIVIGYRDAIHGVLRVHVGNTSAAAVDPPFAHLREVQRQLLAAYERRWKNQAFLAPERRALRRRMARQRFWDLGYNLLWNGGDRSGALHQYRRALRVWPWDLRMWKTFARAALGPPVRQGQNLFPFNAKDDKRSR